MKKIVSTLLIAAIFMLAIATSTPSVQASGPYTENFSEYPNGTSPSGWVNPGNSWAVENGTYQEHASNGWAMSWYTGQVFTDFRFTVMAQGIVPCYGGQLPPVLAMVFRAQTSGANGGPRLNNYYFWGDIDKIQVQEYVDGNWQWPASGPSSAWKNIGQIPTTGTWLNMTVIVNGNTITAIWNNKYTLTVTDSLYGSGYIGLASYNCPVEFSDVIVTPLSAASSTGSTTTASTSTGSTTSSSTTSTTQTTQQSSTSITSTTSSTQTTTLVTETCQVVFTESGGSILGEQISNCS